MAEGAEENSTPRQTRRWRGLLLKVGLLGVAVWFISGQVSWLDSFESKAGKLIRGTITEGAEPEAVSLRIRDEETGEVTVIDGKREIKAGKPALGLRSTFKSLTPKWYLLGMVMILGMYCLGIARWRLLLNAQGLPCTYWRSFRLTFMGFFCNNFMPGMTGGDVAKAVLIARDSPGRRSEAVSTVIVDRVIGLAVLAFLSALAILSNFSSFKQQGIIVFAVLGVCILAFICFFSRRVRRRLRLDRILRSLPFSEILMKLDRAFQLYRSSPKALLWAFLLSAMAHFFNIGSVYVFGIDLGIPANFVTYFATVPIALIISSVPLIPGGWGVREAAFIAVFMAVGVPPEFKSQVALLSVILGISVMLWSLLGGVFLLSGRRSETLPTEIPEAI